MPKGFRILANRKKLWAVNLSRKVKSFLEQNGYVYSKDNPGYTIVIGGDGTLYYYLNKLFGKVLLIGSGHSYRAQLNNRNWKGEILEKLRNRTVSLPVMRISKRNSGLLGHFMNEVVFHTNNFCTTSIQCNYDSKMMKFKGDGIIIATPFGSTAYSYSAGGSALSLGSNKLCITPIAPCLRSVSPATAKARKVVVRAKSNCALLLDGMIRLKKAPGVYAITYSNKKIKFILA